MKNITIETLLVDGQHFSLTAEELAKYPAEYRHAWEFTARPIRTADLMKVDAALNRREGLFRADGRGNGEGMALARAEELLPLVLTGWNHVDADGAKIEISRESVANLPPDVVFDLAIRVQRPEIPTPEALEALKPSLPKK